jgi:probable non-F420 flavinoid oxidoreductase
MAVIGFHCSHEQIHPLRLLRDVQHAEEAGFTAAMSSDHLSPWSSRQGESGYAWSWLGAALATTGLPFGVVTAPGQRYHPAIAAQKIATLAAMFPGRFWAALGSGEASNERVTGDPWPRKPVRDARLRECADVIRRMLAGEEVTHQGLVTVDRAKVWTLPDRPPDLLVAAVTPATAARHAAWAAGLITVNQPPAQLREALRHYREAGGRGPARLQIHLSWAPSEQEAEHIAYDQWRSNVFGPPVSWDADSVEMFDEMSRTVRPADVRGTVLVSADLGQHTAWLGEFLDLGFDELYLHFVGKEQQRFIDTFGEHVLGQLTTHATAGAGVRKEEVS